MLVHTASDEQIEFFAPPLVLEKDPGAAARLPQVAVQPEVFVVQGVPVVFDACGEFRGKEQQFFECVGVLRSRHECSVARGPVGVGIPSGAEVAVAVYALGRGIDTRAVTAVRTEIVELHASAVDFVVELLGYVGHVGRTVQCVSSAAELVDMVVFGRQTHVGR